MFSKGQISMTSLEECETVFLAVKDHLRSHLIYCLEHSETFAGKYVTILETCNGIILYTQNKNQLMVLLNSLIKVRVNLIIIFYVIYKTLCIGGIQFCKRSVL